MKKIVVMSGGFHPFHAGHADLYEQAKKAFPDAKVLVCATNAQTERPFPFKIKKALAELSGVPPKDFIEVSRQFSPEDPALNQQIGDLNEAIVIFVRSDKDEDEQPKGLKLNPAVDEIPIVTRGVNKGKPQKILDYEINKNNLLPASQHTYMAYLKTVEFGGGLTSASEIRAEWPKLDNEGKLNRVMSLYPKTQKNKNLADIAVKMLDAGIIGDQVNEEGVEEATLINDPEQGHLIVPDGGMGTWDEKSLLSNLIRKFSSMAEMIKEKRYSNLYHSLYEAGAVENMLKALVQYENFKETQGNRPITKGKEIDISESTDYISEK